jgi:hypothetical protein
MIVKIRKHCLLFIKIVISPEPLIQFWFNCTFVFAMPLCTPALSDRLGFNWIWFLADTFWFDLISVQSNIQLNLIESLVSSHDRIIAIMTLTKRQEGIHMAVGNNWQDHLWSLFVNFSILTSQFLIFLLQPSVTIKSNCIKKYKRHLIQSIYDLIWFEQKHLIQWPDTIWFWFDLTALMRHKGLRTEQRFFAGFIMWNLSPAHRHTITPSCRVFPNLTSLTWQTSTEPTKQHRI